MEKVRDVASRVRLGAAGALVVACLVLRGVFVTKGSALFPLYRELTKAVIGAQACMASVVPFALWDCLAAGLVVCAVVWLVRCLRRRRSFLPWLSAVVLVGALALALFVGWAFNHYAPPLADELDLEVGTYSTDELYDATRFYLEEAARRAAEVPRDADGALVRQDFYELARIAGASYGGLAEEYVVFRGSTAPVKGLLLWGGPLLYSGHTGIFFAPTGEAGVPLDVAVADAPFIMCHEAAHRLGIASEQEANFAAFLACEASEDVRFSYSGYYNAFCYCLNALWRYDPERAQQLLQDVADEGLYQGVVYVLGDRAATREHYDAYEGTFEEVGRAVNDTYLRSFGEAEGVRSYGLVVDYLIAWNVR